MLNICKSGVPGSNIFSFGITCQNKVVRYVLRFVLKLQTNCGVVCLPVL